VDEAGTGAGNFVSGDGRSNAAAAECHSAFDLPAAMALAKG